MYLKSIDIFGYKSFAAKTHLDLEPGITGIIGPNGCGKSNIMESVRWCLGEMSWKSLRAGAMTDVIFSGTSKRPAMSMTEVTLTFDNASQMLPVQYSEVTITRRIYRSGESAYFMNKTQCRLRDIRELFLDTGVGGDGYAIIDQGGVDAMIKAKPEERRAFFEEAAGVAKYNAKREEALRKLERVDMDMGRLQDSVALINEQVKKLDSDARKAKLFQKYKEELAAAEAAHVLQQLSQLERELAVLSEQVGPLQETLGSKKVEMDAEGAQLAAHNLEKAGTQSQVLEVNQKISEAKAELGRLEERIQASERSVVEMDERAKAAEAERQGMLQRLSGIDPEIERAAQSVSEAQAARDAAQQEADAWNAQLETILSRMSEAETALEEARRGFLSAQENSLGRRRKLAEAESAWSRQEMQARASLKELDKDLSQVQASESALTAARAALSEQSQRLEQSRAEASQREQAVAAARQKLSALSDEAMRLHVETAQVQARIQSIEEQGGQNPYWVGAQAVVNAGIPGVVGTVRQLLRVEDAYKGVLEDLLGERLYAVVCEDSSAARQAVELLEASGKGRARFLVLSSLTGAFADRAYPEESKPLIRHIGFEPAHEKAVRFLLEEAYCLGKVVFGDHWIYGGAADKAEAQVSLSDISELRQREQAAASRSEALAGERSACEQAIAEAEMAWRQASAAVGEELGKESGLRAQIEEKQRALSEYQSSAELSRAESARALAEMALAREEIKAVRGDLDRLAQEEEAARAKEGEAARALSALKEEFSRGQATQEVFASKLQGLVEKLTFMTGAYERLSAERESLQAQAERRAQELSELAQRRQEAQNLAAQSRQRVEELGVCLAGLENEAKAIFERLHELERQIQSREGLLRGLRQLVEETQEQLHKFEVEASGRRTTQDMLKKRLWDEWQLTSDEAKTKYASQSVDPDRIEFLRKRIVNLGNVNMAAPEEYEALAQKQTFLQTQIEDLTKAKEDLRAAITKINSATRENFRNTFTEVREHFRKLYAVLFEGGEADLIMTDPENLLETGIEIMAQPPGKRLQSIMLLSGGEKTLTAIALLFSFFMVKPSPFCMLDEADAALDDANVDRFVGLLKEFQARSQFLIVSHNKRTMEAAGVIYGVTMEEMGVSQLVSVDFRKKDKGVEPSTRHDQRGHGPFAAPAGPSSSEASAETAAAVSATLTETVVETAAEAPPSEPTPEEPQA